MSENHISPEIYDIVRAHHLGTVTARYGTKPVTTWHYHFSLATIIIVIWLGLFAFATTATLFLQPFQRPSPRLGTFSILWLIFWIVVLWLLLGKDIRRTFQQTDLYVCESGLLGYKEKKAIPIRWENIKFVWFKNMAIRRMESGEDGNEGDKEHEDEEGILEYQWRYTFHCMDGKKYTFSGDGDVTALSHHVDKEITHRLLPAAIAAYEAGQAVNFGAVQVSSKGMQIGKEAFAWQNIFSVEMEGDHIIIRLPDWEHYVGIEQDAIPNVCVLKALMQHIATQEEPSVFIDTHPQADFSPRQARYRRAYRRQNREHYRRPL